MFSYFSTVGAVKWEQLAEQLERRYPCVARKAVGTFCSHAAPARSLSREGLPFKNRPWRRLLFRVVCLCAYLIT